MKSACILVLAAVLAACSTEVEPLTVDTSASEFIGGAACANCHESQYKDWQGSHHELAMQVADPSTVLGDFSAAASNIKFSSVARSPAEQSTLHRYE